MSLIPIRVGFFLAVRQIKHASLWTTVLIIFVMTLTFLNLVVVNGVLVGLIQSSVEAERAKYTGDIIISNLNQKPYIERTTSILSVVQALPGLLNYSGRYLASGVIEAGYKTKVRPEDITESAGGVIAGIDPVKEDAVTGLSHYMVEGSYLLPTDYDQILIGANLLYKYTPIDTPGLKNLKTAGLGSKVRLVIGSTTREVTIKGIVKSKVGELDQRIFMVDTQLRDIIGRTDLNMNEIAIKLLPGADVLRAKQVLLDNGFDQVAKIQTFEEAQPKFLKDISDTFAILGNLIGSIGLAVASITIFIVIFVNAITRRKFIGILKGIGVDSRAIEYSYIFQSIFYAMAGTGIGWLVLYGFLVPYIVAHPINFPFSDGILYAPVPGSLLRVGILLITTVIAGYIPARLIVKRNTLDAILGR
ncbi:MAG: hypothetical protein PHF79_03920 [Candidatus Pacebacteria bacterium]|nr:hypothetical protein [Candidatus Paceibacterota bacterium]